MSSKGQDMLDMERTIAHLRSEVERLQQQTTLLTADIEGLESHLGSDAAEQNERLALLARDLARVWWEGGTESQAFKVALSALVWEVGQ